MGIQARVANDLVGRFTGFVGDDGKAALPFAQKLLDTRVKGRRRARNLVVKAQELLIGVHQFGRSLGKTEQRGKQGLSPIADAVTRFCQRRAPKSAGLRQRRGGRVNFGQCVGQCAVEIEDEVFDHPGSEGYCGRMDRVTSDLIAFYHQDFPQEWRFDELMLRSKQEAARADVDFMSLGEAEMAMFAQILKLTGAHLKPSKWVEIGALTGFSALCIFSTLAEGSELWTIEKSPERCAFMRNLFSDPRLGGRLHVVEGDSRLAKATLEQHGPFDGIFLDGAKAEYQNDLDWAEKNTRKDALICADNVFLGGAVFEEGATEKGTDRYSAKQVQIMHGYLTRVSEPGRYETFMLPSSDGLAISRKLF